MHHILYPLPPLLITHQAVKSVSDKKWKYAKKFGNFALYLSISNLVYTLTIAVFILGLIMGLAYKTCDYYYDAHNKEYCECVLATIL